MKIEITEGDAREVVKRLRDHGYMRHVAAHIEAQLPKPKPEEPRGLGAVVRDVNDRLYVRNHQGREPWIWQTNRPVDPRYSWNELKVTEILSEGFEV